MPCRVPWIINRAKIWGKIVFSDTVPFRTNFFKPGEVFYTMSAITLSTRLKYIRPEKNNTIMTANDR